MKKFFLLISHLAAMAAGFALGIYVLPILIAPDGPSSAEVRSMAKTSTFTATVRRDLKGNDFLHWGEGTLSLSAKSIAFRGKLAPGPDYKLYLAPSFVETEEAFLTIKDQSARVGNVTTFDNFIVALPADTDLEQYNTVVIWCETFAEFITAAKYR